MMDFYYLEDGSVVGELNGRPYNFHPVATPEQWEWFQAELNAGSVNQVSPPPEPEPAPVDPAVEEAHWRAEQMPLAQQNVTALTYGETDIPGTVADWQQYWLALRKWVEGAPGFPEKNQRPAKPA